MFATSSLRSFFSEVGTVRRLQLQNIDHLPFRNAEKPTMLQIQSAFQSLRVQLIHILLCWMIFIYHTSRSRSRQLQRLGLGLVSDAERLVSVSDLGVSGLVSVSSRPKCPTSRSCLGLEPLRLGSRLGLGLKGLVHITACKYECLLIHSSVL